MDLLASFRFFCGHYSFNAFDSSLPEPWNEPSELRGLTGGEASRRIQRGRSRSGRVIRYHTLGDFNDHRIDVYRSTSLVDHGGADRVTAHNLPLPSGTLTLFGLDDGENVVVGPGDYIVQCRAFHPGVEWHGDPIEDDAEFLRHDELERYELILVPGRVDREEVTFGPQTFRDGLPTDAA